MKFSFFHKKNILKMDIIHALVFDFCFHSRSTRMGQHKLNEQHSFLCRKGLPQIIRGFEPFLLADFAVRIVSNPSGLFSRQKD